MKKPEKTNVIKEYIEEEGILAILSLSALVFTAIAVLYLCFAVPEIGLTLLCIVMVVAVIFAAMHFFDFLTWR